MRLALELGCSTRGSGLLQLVPYIRAAMVPRINIRQLTMSTGQTVPNNRPLRVNPVKNQHAPPAKHNHDEFGIVAKIFDHTEAKIKDLDIPIKEKERKAILRGSRKGRADLLARLTIDTDMRGQRLGPQCSRLLSDLRMIQRYIFEWRYGMALHIAEDPSSTGTEMRRILGEKLISAIKEINKMVIEAKEVGLEMDKTITFSKLISDQERKERTDLAKQGLPASMQAWAKSVAATLEREDQEPIVENGRSSVQPTKPDNASLSESHEVQELAIEHKLENPDSGPASLDSATASEDPWMLGARCGR